MTIAPNSATSASRRAARAPGLADEQRNRIVLENYRASQERANGNCVLKRVKRFGDETAQREQRLTVREQEVKRRERELVVGQAKNLETVRQLQESVLAVNERHDELEVEDAEREQKQLGLQEKEEELIEKEEELNEKADELDTREFGGGPEDVQVREKEVARKEARIRARDADFKVKSSGWLRPGRNSGRGRGSSRSSNSGWRRRRRSFRLGRSNSRRGKQRFRNRWSSGRRLRRLRRGRGIECRARACRVDMHLVV